MSRRFILECALDLPDDDSFAMAKVLTQVEAPWNAFIEAVKALDVPYDAKAEPHTQRSAAAERPPGTAARHGGRPRGSKNKPKVQPVTQTQPAASDDDDFEDEGQLSTAAE